MRDFWFNVSYIPNHHLQIYDECHYPYELPTKRDFTALNTNNTPTMLPSPTI
jgi:hypothetical protein